MSRNVAKLAETTEKQQLADRKSISKQYALTVAVRQASRLNPKPTDLFIAANASQSQEKRKGELCLKLLKTRLLLIS